MYPSRGIIKGCKGIKAQYHYKINLALADILLILASKHHVEWILYWCVMKYLLKLLHSANNICLYLSGGSGEQFPTALILLLSLDHSPLLVPPQTLNLCYCKLLFPDFLLFTAVD